MSSCVIKNKDFYSLAEEHGVDGNELELIVHKYWNEVGREDSFPPSSYINEQLGIGKSYDETSENVRKLWDRDYSRPIKFKSEYELNGAVQKAKTFFPADTITTYKDSKGKFVLRIAEPVTSSSIDKEIQDILAKAPRNSKGRLLAPNGNLSNLNEKQYAQVRTKAFKKWFGDWEKANTFNIDAIDTSKVDIEFHDKSWKNDSTKINKTLRIYIKGQHEKGYFELVKDYEFGMFSVHFKTTKAGAKYNSSIAIESTKEDRKILFTELSKAIPEGGMVSTWGSLSEDGVRGIDNVGRGMTKVGERKVTLKSNGNTIKIPIYQKGKGVSKVVDENGEPLVTWHSTLAEIKNNIFRDYEDITISRNEEWVTNKNIYDYKKEGYIITNNDILEYNKGNKITIKRPNGIYSSSERDVSNTYTKKEYEAFDEYDQYTDWNADHKAEQWSLEEEALYDKFKKEVENNVPEEYKAYNIGIDAHKEYVIKEAKKRVDKEMSKRHPQGKQEFISPTNPYDYSDNILGSEFALFNSIKNPLIVDANYSNWNEIEYNNEIHSTRSLEKYARDNGYDGIIVKNVYDVGSFARKEGIKSSTIIASFNSNQVKSATDNIGTFSTIDNNINHDTTSDNTISRSSISYAGQEEATARVQSFIDSIDKSGEYGQAIQEFIDTFGLPIINEVIFNITQANTHSSSWNNFTRALKLGFSEMASSEEKAAVTLHELIHSRTTSLANLYEKAHGVKSLKSKEKSKVFESLSSDALTPEIEKAFDNIVECKAEVLKYLEENPEIKEALLSTDVTTNLNKRPLYAILKETDKYRVREFISEIYTNPAFIQLLKSIPTKVKKQSLWDKFVNALRSIFGKKKAYISVLDRARENANVIVRAGNNTNAAFETISEDATSLPINEQRAQLRNYYASIQTRSSQEFKQVRALASQAFKSKHTFESEAKAKAIADKYIRDNHIDSDMVAYTYGYKVKGQQFFVPVIKWKSDAEYANAKHISAGDYVNSLTNSEVESEILRLSADEEMFDSTFTFKDGTTIDTPFELNVQQKEALQKIDDFANDKTKIAITLSGYAGTGKTSLMEMVAKKLRRRYNVVFSATTHQAAGVLKSKVGKYGFDTRTVNSLFGIAVETDMDNKVYDMSKTKIKQVESKLNFGDIVVLDEASMLSDKNYDDVVTLAKMYHAKIIFVGDRAQLAPVGQTEVSKVFRDSNGEVVELTKVERTGNNAILSEATAIRNGQNFTYESAFNSQGQGVAYVTPQSTDVISSVIETFTPGLKTNPNYLRILAFTNASVANYNSKVRQSLGYNGLAPQVGEPMLGYANWGYDRSRASSGDPYQFVNSRSYKVVATQTPYKSGVRLSDGTICSFDILPLRLEDSMGEQVTVPFIDIKNNIQNRNSAKLAAQEKAILWTKWRTAQGMQKKALLDAINELENFLFINDNLTGDQNNLLQAKVIDFGYAHTIHKSQGGTYTHVIMDDGGIESSRSTAAMKQQLKYVGVSRATDTVTIISPQTKKADSPVNHMQVGPEEVNNSNIAPTRPQNTQTESINIFAGTGENAHLSNFAERPFTHTWSNGEKTVFHSVEQAFQFAKAMMFRDREAAQAILAQTEGAKIKGEGRKVKGYNDAQWKQHRASFMKAFIKESFMQNPKALEQLLATGNATLTHNQDKSAWGQMFPQILMQVRDELRNYTPTESPLVEAVLNQFSGYFEGGGADIMKYYPGLSKEIVDKLENYIMGDGEFTESNAKRFLEEASSKKQQSLAQLKEQLPEISQQTLDKIQSIFKEYNTRADEDVWKANEWLYSITLPKSERIEVANLINWYTLKNGDNEFVSASKSSAYFTNNLEAAIQKFLEEAKGKSSASTPLQDINSISQKSAAYGVTIDANLKQNWREWQNNNSNGIVAYRVNFNKYNTAEEAQAGRIGNPFSETQRGKDTVQQFYEWLVTGNNFGNSKATEEYRQAIIDKLKSIDTPNILYYTELNRPSHATVLGYLMEHKELLGQPSSSHASVSTLQDPRVSLAEHAPSQQGSTDMLPPVSPIDTTTPINQIPAPNSEGPLKGFTLHSGGAKGADFAWGNIGASYGVTGKHYFDATDTREGKQPPYGNTPITDEDRTLGERKAFYAGKTMGRLSSRAQKVADPLLIRDWNQVKNSDMVVAIAQKFDMPGDKFSNKSDDERVALVQQVSGGTGWAVQMAISEGKPVFVFNQADGKWYMNFMGVWKYAEAPVLSNNFAGIGTRGINAAGEAAIRECYEKTVASMNSQSVRPTIEETVTQAEKPFDRESLSTEMQEEFDRLTKRTTQINNILSSGVMTSIEAREIVDSLMNLITDYITEIINDPAINDIALKEQGNNAYLANLLVNKNFEGLIAPFNPKGLTRLEIINKIGIDNLVNVFLKSKLTATATTTRAQAKKMRVLSQNLDAILYLGANTLSINEGIHLTTTRVNGKEMKAMEEGIVVNPDLNSASDTESMQENEGSLQEKWQIDSRTVDVVESMSQLVRNELFKLYQLDSSGNKITDGIGIYKRVPVQETTKQLLNWLQGCLTLRDAVARLKDKQAANPWVKQLIDMLDVEALGENAGQYTDFQNSFFSVFNKHFQSYSATTITYDKDGVQHIKRIPLNEKPFLKETLGQIKVDIASGIHPLFTANNGVNQLAFENFKTVLNTLHTIRDTKIAKIGFDKMSGADRQLAFEAISQAASLLGYPTDATTLGNMLNGREIRNMITNLDNIYDDILVNVNNPNYEPLTFTRSEDDKKGSGIRGSLTKFLEPLTKHLSDIAVSSIFDSGKMYQSHVTPSYMTKLMLKFSEEDPVKFDQFIQEEFGKYDWFRDTSIRDPKAGWKSGWIGLLARDPAARKIFKHEAKLNYNKHNYMKNMTGNEYIMSLLSSFFSEGAGSGKDTAVAWYRIPILSNKPSEEYIRFYADMGSDYKEVISTKLAKVFNQELSRIQTVRMQNYDKSDPRFIKNFHENGKRFCFLDFMNVYLEGGARANTELGKLLRAKLEGTNWDVANEPRLLDLAKRAIQANMQTRIDEILKNYETRGIMEIAENIDGIKQGFGKDNIAENIERFLWNDAYAATQILQLTVTDIAYYKDMEDLQKRIAQIHAPGIRGNAEAVDYEGNRVSDGFERTIYLTDFDRVKSNIIDNVKIVFDRKLEELKNQPLENFSNTKIKTDEDVQRAAEAKKQRIMIQEELYNNILKQFEDINVADAQGYSSPTSYRKKMFIFGKWSKEAENIYQKLLTGNYNYHDLQVAFQPLKPFVYSQITKPTGLENGPLKSLKMPVQNKNSEYLLIMADAILQGENTGQPNLLRAIYEVMEESAKASPTKGIDTIQFESTVKSGLMGRNDINRVLEGGKWNELIETKDPNTGKTVQRTRGEVAAKAYLQHNLYSKDANGVVTGYNSTYVHEIPFEDYCLQQEVPEHFKDHAQQHGSQIRMITPSDLLSVDTYGNPVTYNVEGRELSAKEFREEYENTIADNIQQSIDEVFRELHLDAANPVEKNIVLSRMLQDEILSSPRYGLDMYLACSLNPVTGEFRIPLGDPIQANRIEQLLNSIIKKRVNEQKIAGGPVVQVSNFGTSRRLNIRFKDKNGGLLKTREEFTKDWKPVEPAKMDVKSLANKLIKEEKLSYTIALKEAKRRIEESQNATQQTADEAYAEYIKNNQGGIAYFEVFAPIFNEEIFTRFADPDGTIDIATMEKVCPEALQMIGYRIPTEDKYSCAPIKIVGFLPREAGEGIMLPYDITLLTGSDFDVDKEYLMRKQIHVNLKSFKEQYEALKPIFLEEKKKESKLSREFTSQELKQFKSELSDMIDMFRSNDRTRSYIREAEANPIEKKMWQKFKEVGYNIVKATKDKEYRDNKIFDMTWEVLSHETTADKMLNPGGFEEQKKMAYLVETYRNSDKTWEELQAMKTDDLKKLSYSTKNLIFADSQVQFYEQNNAASTILGMFAVQKIGHAVLESNSYQIDVEEACDIAEPFTIMGKQFGGKMEFDPMIDDEGNVIGKTLGSHVAAAADAAKEPCMNLLNINSMTTNVHSTLIRLGMPFRHASLFLAQPVIRELLDRYNKRNLTDFASLDTILNEYIQEFREEGNMADSAIEHEEITEQELIDNLRANKPETNYKVATAFGKLQKLAYAIKGPTYLTRYNSISNAVGPLITDNIVTEFKTNYETAGLYDRHGNELAPEIVFADHPVLRKFAAAYEVANKIFEEFPTKSQAFSKVLESIPGSLQDKFLNDRGLLNDLKDFFLSHTLVDNRVVNENRAGYYIKEFAGEFAANGIKEKNLDNEFIQAIKIKQDKDTGEFSLELSTTGMDQQKKDRLSASWYELYKKNQPLAMDLFNYCFFKGGIGFNPKTFMNLLPLQMRESIQGYKESFTNIPTESAKYILEQFLAHNTSNHKLFPIKEGKKDVVGGGLIIQDKAELSQYADTPAFRIKDSNNRWRYLLLDKVTEDALAYKEIIPLGDNGEYLEMSSTRVPNISIREIYGTNRKSKKQDTPKQSEVTNNTNHPMDDTNRGLVTQTPAQEKSKAEKVIQGIMNSELGMRTPELAKKYLTANTIINADGQVEISNPTVWKYLSAAMESQGLTADKNELKDVLDKLC